MLEFDQELDACGLSCPLPILRTRKALQKMAIGEVLHIIATDPGTVIDIQAFSHQNGHELLESREEDGTYYYLLRKA